MKRRTSSSVAPLLSCSRMTLRRSTASSALESAMVWFWQTRQRSSFDTDMTRLSRSAFSSEKTIPEKNSRTKSTLLTFQLLHEGNDFLRHRVGRDRADLLVADDPLLVHDVGF